MALTAAALEVLIANAGTYFVALGTDADPIAATFSEISDPTYIRAEHSAWTTVVAPNGVARTNSGAIVFDALTNGATVTWWAIYTAAEGGSMLACGRVTDTGGVAEPISVEAGDEVRFDDGALGLFSTRDA